MSAIKADVVVLGSGFGGSLMTLLLHRIGLRPVLIDRGRHPRFAIGESSTPVADLVLADLAQNYDLPRLTPLAKYGSWKASYPEVCCGNKRGFSYFLQRPGESFVPRADHGNELLVAASSSDELSDTHWLRSDVDAFLAAEVRRRGLPFFEGIDTTLAPRPDGWNVAGTDDGGSLSVAADFLVDATGEAGAVLRALGLPRDTGRCQTRSRAIFAHFEGVKPWGELLGNVDQAEHPFPCDHAALHQLLDEGWMWQLRFDSGIVSAGFAIDEARFPLDPSIPVEQEWNDLLDRYPSIAEQFTSAKIVAPAGGLRRTGRLQRSTPRSIGPTWALLPNTAGFIDPLHSTGIAQTLCGIERFVQLAERHWRRPGWADGLASYERKLRCELRLVDEIVSGGYAARRDFPAFAAFSMLYFAAATTYERRRQQGELPRGAAFLCADDPALQSVVAETGERLRRLLMNGVPDERSLATFERQTARAIEPFNRVGLFDPAARNMYWHTVAR